ncbi:hypothetical protein [Ramlibacter sp. AN1133]|uniref:hypothetical protein n=1 Tax=Ramlibacter sp. AN1133 TaxID=3133429 RepID=UPI0030BCF9B8
MDAVVSRNPLEALGQSVPAYAMMPAEYRQRIIPVAVYPQMEGGKICLSPANQEAEAALERVRLALEPLATQADGNPSAWAAGAVRELLDMVNAQPGFASPEVHASCAEIRGQQIMILKQAALDTGKMSLEVAIRRVHRNIVAEALEKGDPVPRPVLIEHQLEDVGAEREIAA